MAITITIKKDFSGIDNLCARLAEGTGLMGVLGKTREVGLQRHFRSRPPNRRGWPSTGFWKNMSQNTNVGAVTANTAEVLVGGSQYGPAFDHKLTGGVISARPGKALAIPLTAEAAAAGNPRMGRITGLRVLKWKGGNKAFLGTKDASGRLKLLWILVRSVNQKADPEALPPAEQEEAALVATAERWIARAAR